MQTHVYFNVENLFVGMYQIVQPTHHCYTFRLFLPFLVIYSWINTLEYIFLCKLLTIPSRITQNWNCWVTTSIKTSIFFFAYLCLYLLTALVFVITLAGISRTVEWTDMLALFLILGEFPLDTCYFNQISQT